jgi:hypothetical protein
MNLVLFIVIQVPDVVKLLFVLVFVLLFFMRNIHRLMDECILQRFSAKTHFLVEFGVITYNIQFSCFFLNRIYYRGHVLAILFIYILSRD